MNYEENQDEDNQGQPDYDPSPPGTNLDQNREQIEVPDKNLDLSLTLKQIHHKKKRHGLGRKDKAISEESQGGRYVRDALPKGRIRHLAFAATIRMAAPYQCKREKNNLAMALKKSDLREKILQKKIGATILFVVDASGSMGAGKRMGAVKGAVLSLLKDAYQKRDKVGMIAFRKNSAEVLLEITRSVDLAQKSLRELPTGGKTPLAHGLYKAYELFKAAKIKDPDLNPLLVLVSDGRANVSLKGDDCQKEVLEAAKMIATEDIKSLVIDTESGRIKFGLALEIAHHLEGNYYKIDHLTDGKIDQAVRNQLGEVPNLNQELKLKVSN